MRGRMGREGEWADWALFSRSARLMSSEDAKRKEGESEGWWAGWGMGRVRAQFRNPTPHEQGGRPQQLGRE